MSPFPFARRGGMVPPVLTLVGALSASGPALAQETPATLPEVVVSSSADASAAGLSGNYAGNQVARGGRVGIFGNQDMLETPFSTTSYTSELIQNQQARSVADVLQNDPTVRMSRGFGNFQELYVVRGFPVPSDDMTYNGLYGILPRQYLAAELIERVEVLRGANSFLSGGAGAASGFGVGGTVNILPKRAPIDPYNSVTLGLDNGGHGLVSGDFARRFGEDQRLGLRLNLAKRKGESTVDNEDRDLGLAVLGADYRGRGYRLSADIGWQNHRIDRPRPNVTPTAGLPAPPDARRNFAQAWTTTGERSTFGTARAEFDLTPDAIAWLALGARKGRENNRLANPNVDAAGNMTQSRFDNVREDTARTAEAGLRGNFTVAGIKNTAVASINYQSLETSNAFAVGDFAGFPAGTLYQPLQVAMPPATALMSGNMDAPRLTDKSVATSLALADTASFMEDRLRVTVGARYQRLRTNAYSADTGAETSRAEDSELSPMAGVVYRFTPQISGYVNYIEGLTRGDAAPATFGTPATPVANAGQFLPSYISRQKEVGVKYDGGKLGATAAFFTTNKPFGIVDVASAVYMPGGEQRNQGVELAAFGEPVRGVRLLGGLTFLDAEIISSQGGTLNGRRAIGVPRQQANAGVEWDVPGVPGLAVNGRVVYTGSQYADAANAAQVASWTRLDLGARYTLALAKQVLTVRARLDNALARDYWASAGGYPNQSYLVLGMPRTLTVTGTLDF